MDGAGVSQGQGRGAERRLQECEGDAGGRPEGCRDGGVRGKTLSHGFLTSKECFFLKHSKWSLRFP